MMSGTNQGSDTLGAIASAGRGRGTGRGQKFQPVNMSGTGRGSQLAPQLAPQQVPQQNPQYQHQHQMLPQQQYGTPLTSFPQQNNYTYDIDQLLSQQPKQQQQYPMSMSMLPSSQPSTKATETSNKKILDMLVGIVNLLEKNNNTIKSLDDRTKNMENVITDISNNLITREYIAHLLSTLSKLPDDKDVEDEVHEEFDDALNRINLMSTDNDKPNTD